MKKILSMLIVLSLFVGIGVVAAEEERKLEIFHWWVGPGEREAADEWFKALHAKYPEVEVVENPVAGGGGVSHRVVLQGRLAAGLPPDTFQALGGAEIKAYVDGGYLLPLDDLWKELDYKNVIPGPLANTFTFDGKFYGIPLNMHIQNILYYNKKLFDELGLQAPKTFDELMAAAAAIKKAKPEMHPLGLGTKEKWEAAFVLDAILLGEGGPEYYVKLFKGEIDVKTDATFRAALEKLAQLKEYTYPFHSNLTWDQSVSLVVSGDAAMVTMGTWAIGAFLNNKWQPGQDFGALTFPQGDDRYLLFHADSFVLPKGAPRPGTTTDFLRVTASPDLQIPCDVVQGGLVARIDIDPTVFPDPVRQEMQAYIRDNPTKLVLDQHGSIAPASFSNEYWTAIAGFMGEDKPDIDKTLSQVDTLFKTYEVKEEAAWYVWP
jgi:glucose/mannose transport system substrate-binding protein